MKLSCLKGENNMDMIAEILQTDKAAAGKLEKADIESGELLERTVKEAQELKENALKEAEAYKTQKAKEVTERINTESEKITSAQNEKTTSKSVFAIGRLSIMERLRPATENLVRSL